MLKILGPGSRLCDGLTRRELLRGRGAVVVRGVDLAAAAGGAERRAGPSGSGQVGHHVQFARRASHIDMFDMKPSAPAEIRGSFSPSPRRFPPGHLRAPAQPRRSCTSLPGPHFSHGFNSHDPLAVLDRLHRRRLYRTGQAERPAGHRGRVPVPGQGAKGHAGGGVPALLSRLGRVP